MDIQPIHFVTRQKAFDFYDPSPHPSVALTPDVIDMINRHAVVAVGVSGGKDSVACAIAVSEYLDSVGHAGPRLLVHADLGRVEWKDSLPACERLAGYLGWELLTVRRAAGDMLDRWQTRWQNNVARYRDLSCMKLILPWSTPSWRFCTSELKQQVIMRALKKRFPAHDIINVTGIRRQESKNRRTKPVSDDQKNLARKGFRGLVWNAIIEWPIETVFSTIVAHGLALHEAYTKYRSSRVSCVYCIMSSANDLAAAASCSDNHAVYVDMVRLEACSTFAFQGKKWLADVAPHLLPPDLIVQVLQAKEAARLREEAEALLPAHLLYDGGWPTAIPTLKEAQTIAEVRRRVAAAVGIEVGFLDPVQIIQRFDELLRIKAAA